MIIITSVQKKVGYLKALHARRRSRLLSAKPAPCSDSSYLSTGQGNKRLAKEYQEEKLRSAFGRARDDDQKRLVMRVDVIYVLLQL